MATDRAKMVGDACYSTVILVAVVLLLLTVTNVVLGTSSSEVNAKWQRHYDLFKLFPCGRPQPRSISVETLLMDRLDPSESAVPHATVLHRCDSGTGCCSFKSQVCTVADVEEVELHFFITDAIRKGRSTFRAYRVANHTRCSCQSLTNDIK